MRVLQINCVYKKGSTGKIMVDIHNILQKNGIESFMCYGRGENTLDENTLRVSNEIYSKFNNLWSRVTGMPYGGCFFSTWQLKSTIKKIKPDVVHLHCINGFFVNIYEIINWLKKNKYNTVLTLHAEFMYTGNCGSSMGCDNWLTGCKNCPSIKTATGSYFFNRTVESFEKMCKAFDGFDENLKIAAVSDWLKQRALNSPILRNKDIVTVVSGINTENIFFHRVNVSVYGDIVKNGEKKILHVTSGFSDPVKGGKYVIELAERLKNSDVKIILVGNSDKNLLLPENIIDVGIVRDQNKLAEFYSGADLTLITSYQETASMVTEESLSCGTPVFGFKAGGPESIGINEFCSFVDYGDTDSLANMLKKYLFESEAFDKSDISSKARMLYSSDRMGREYIDLYDQFNKK